AGAQQGKEPLDGAVLAVGAVENGENDIRGGEDVPGAVTGEETEFGGITGSAEHRLDVLAVVGDGRQLAAVGAQLRGIRGSRHPGSPAGDADAVNREPLWVEVVDDCSCGDAGHGVLGRLATVNDGDGEFFSCSHSANPTRLSLRIAVAHHGDGVPLSLRLAGAPQQLVNDLLRAGVLVA